MRLSFAAMAYFSLSAASVVVCGTVLGMSMNDVTPPAAAALLSLCMSAFAVSPGSRKCTWSSITPGIRYMSPASTMQSTSLFGNRSPFNTSVILPLFITMEPLNCSPSFTIIGLLISVLMAVCSFSRR